MRGITQFYTWFWIIYFPVCIAFINVVNYDFSDELLSIALTLYALSHSQFLVKSETRWREIRVFMGVLVFYVVYSHVMSITTPTGIWLDVLQEIRPYFVFYITWMIAPDFTAKQKRLILWVMCLCFVGYTGSFLFAPSLIGYGRYGALAGAESVAMGQIALCCAMIFYLFTPHTKRNRNIAIVIMLLGLMSGKSKYFGECVCFIALVSFLGKKLRFDNALTFIRFGALAAVVIFFTWTKFDAYYVSGFADDSRMARPITYTTGLQVMKDYFPFGSGFGTFGSAAAAKEYSPLYYKYKIDDVWGLTPELPMFLADTFYPIVYSQFGFFGAILFLIFWKRRLAESNRIPDMNYYRMALMCILALALENTADSSYLSGRGMGYFMILAVCLNSERYMGKDEEASPTAAGGEMQQEAGATTPALTTR